ICEVSCPLSDRASMPSRAWLISWKSGWSGRPGGVVMTRAYQGILHCSVRNSLSEDAGTLPVGRAARSAGTVRRERAVNVGAREIAGLLGIAEGTAVRSRIVIFGLGSTVSHRWPPVCSRRSCQLLPAWKTDSAGCRYRSGSPSSQRESRHIRSANVLSWQWRPATAPRTRSRLLPGHSRSLSRHHLADLDAEPLAGKGVRADLESGTRLHRNPDVQPGLLLLPGAGSQGMDDGPGHERLRDRRLSGGLLAAGMGVEVPGPEVREALVLVGQLTVVNGLLGTGSGIGVGRIEPGDLALAAVLGQGDDAVVLLDHVKLAGESGHGCSLMRDQEARQLVRQPLAAAGEHPQHHAGIRRLAIAPGGREAVPGTVVRGLPLEAHLVTVVLRQEQQGLVPTPLTPVLAPGLQVVPGADSIRRRAQQAEPAGGSGNHDGG